MKRLHFRYEMKLTLDQDVWDHHFLIRCRPAETPGQHCREYAYRIEPADTVSLVTDGFGNCGYAGAVRKPHRLLCVEAEGIVETESMQERRSGYEEDCHPMYRFPSACTEPDEGLRRFLKQVEQEYGGPLNSREGLVVLMDCLSRRLIYAPGVTSVRTTAAEAFAGGQGVCQDYAHVFISLCRLAGIPARYVAGMVPGEGATHAWAEVWLDGQFVGFDPTENRQTDETYIKLTHGRDFADGAVDKGCFLGFANQTQQIYVKVEEIT